MSGTNWSSGYVTEVTYTHGYYAELNPFRVDYALLHSGLAAPEVTTACELGFGQGLSTNIHAAAGPATWFATDFNPAQAANAQKVAQASNNGAHLYDQAFSEFCDRQDLPDFDYIGVHGIWTWISDENRKIIVDFVARKLKVGGVLYISYNTLPGWASSAPMRQLLTEYKAAMTAPGNGIVPGINASLDFASKLLATNPTYSRANANVGSWLERVKGQDRRYLAHEYFNRDWHAMYFADMARWLAPAKVEFACSAHYLDQLDAINLTADQQALFRDIPDPQLRQTVRDFCVNQQFRRDYWIKGPRRLTPLQQVEAFRRQRVLLVKPRADVTYKAGGALGEANLTETVYAPILDVLAKQKPQTLGEIEQALAAQTISLPQIIQAILVLIGKGDVVSVQSDERIQRAKASVKKLNAHLMDVARSSADNFYLASPVTGGGVTVDRFSQLFLMARAQDKTRRARELGELVWGVLSVQNQRVVKEGKTLESAEENIAELTSQAEAFIEKRLPVLKALGIAD